MSRPRNATLGQFPGLVRQLERVREFAHAEPFPHLCIDDCLDETLISKVHAEFPHRDAALWKDEGESIGSYRKRALTDADDRLGPHTKHLIAQLHSAPVIALIEEFTQIHGLVPDPHLYGGGLQGVLSGGFLKLHGDFLLHPTLGLRRRLNLIVYLNQHWRPDFGGELEFWDEQVTQCVRRYAPIWNRAVLFSVDERGYHGHPDPLRCPSETVRKSLSIFYYTQKSKEDAASNRAVAFWRRRPGEMELRPEGRLRSVLPPIVYELRSRPSVVLEHFVPPLLFRAAHAIGARRKNHGY